MLDGETGTAPARPCASTGLREKMIRAGVLVPMAGKNVLKPIWHSRPVLRLDEAGRGAARQHTLEWRAAGEPELKMEYKRKADWLP